MHIHDKDAVAEYLVLGIWEAITLLGQASESCDAPDLSELLTKAEAAGPLTVIDTNDRDREGRVRYHYTLVAVIGHWQSGEGIAGDDADEVAWLTRAEIVDRNLPTAPALLPLLDLAKSRGYFENTAF